MPEATSFVKFKLKVENKVKKVLGQLFGELFQNYTHLRHDKTNIQSVTRVVVFQPITLTYCKEINITILSIISY